MPHKSIDSNFPFRCFIKFSGRLSDIWNTRTVLCAGWVGTLYIFGWECSVGILKPLPLPDHVQLILQPYTRVIFLF